ncbi:MAG: OmpA family protein [Fluviicola sp.]
MKKIQFAFVLFLGITSCVPVKKYNEALEAEKKASEELTAIKSKSIENENARKDLEVYTAKAKSDIIQLRKDTASLGSNFRFLQAQYDLKVAENEVYEHTIDQMRLKGSKETAGFQADIEMRNQELQRKEEALKTMEQELIAKQKMLFEREQRVTELEEMLERKDMAMQTLKAKLVTSLKGFESKGLTVVEKNGKIYVSMEAKLLFASGSTTVEQEGKNALINLAKVLENEKDLEIVVEGHTDTDKLQSANHPKSNWELSVLRATSVIEILIANSKMSPKQIVAAGRGEFFPVDEKDKAKNRRIEVIISPNLNELYQLLEGK